MTERWIDGYPADHYENDMPEEMDPYPERQWDDEGQRWFAELDAEIGAWIHEVRPVTA